MSVLPVGIGSSGGYEISRSVRLRSSATAYLQRTNATTGTDPLKFTVSGWMKRGLSTVTYFPLLGSDTGTNAFDFIGFSADNIAFRIRNSSAVDLVQIISSSVYRDFSAWYHLVAVYDSANATSTERVKLYVNGVQITSFVSSTYPSLNQAPTGTFLTDMQIGRTNTNSTNQNYGDGYVTEINFVDGQALTPSSFGEYDTITGVWKPKKYDGTYGTNGFYLNFSDNSAATAAAIGKDYSGNGNNWTPNNISLTAGATYDSMIDVPTPYDDGNTGRGNYATLNPLYPVGATSVLSNGNLQATTGTTGVRTKPSTIAVASGKWYWEVTPTAASSGPDYTIGIGKTGYTADTGNIGYAATEYSYYQTGVKINNNVSTAYGATFTTNDIIGVALDLDAGTLVFYKNNTSQGTAFSGLSGEFLALASDGSAAQTSTFVFNFGQRPFSYTPPSGFLALNTQNLPTPTIASGADYMAATTYTGNGSTQSITGVGFQPDFTWIKSRSIASGNILIDAVRGVGIYLLSEFTNAEAGGGTSFLTAFNSDGFSVNVSPNTSANANTATYVSWNWNAGGSTVTNTSGSISSQVRANPTAGFSVVTYNGNATAGATVGHGLGVAPSLIITKNRDSATAWHVYHTSLGATQYIVLNTTAAAVTSSASGWNNTAPNALVFSLGASSPSNSNQVVAYCFAAVAGYSAFGKYTGNGSTDGPFVFTGFRPRFVMYKRTNSTGNWIIYDSSRSTYNQPAAALYPNLSNAEDTSHPSDFLSNGFKLRSTGVDSNANGGTYVYMAFAENPFKYSLAR